MSSGQPPWLAPGEGAVKKKKGSILGGCKQPQYVNQTKPGQEHGCSRVGDKKPPPRSGFFLSFFPFALQFLFLTRSGGMHSTKQGKHPKMGGAGRPGPATSAKWQRWERPGSRVTFFWLGMLDSLKDRSALCRILGFYLWISQPAGERQIPNSLSRIGKQTEHWRPTLGTSCFHAGRVSHVVSSSELILNCCLLGGFEEEGFDDLEDPAKIGRLYCRISTRFMNVLVNTMVGNELEGRSAAPGLYHQVPSLAACMPIPLSNQSVSSSLTPPALLARTLGIPNVVATSCSSEAVQQESFPGQENPSFPPAPARTGARTIRRPVPHDLTATS